MRSAPPPRTLARFFPAAQTEQTVSLSRRGEALNAPLSFLSKSETELCNCTVLQGQEPAL